MNVQDMLSNDTTHATTHGLTPNLDAALDGSRTHQYRTRHSLGSVAPLNGATLQCGNSHTNPMSEALKDNGGSLSNSNNKESTLTSAALPHIAQGAGIRRHKPSLSEDDPKNVTFELLFTEDSRFRARLPMKVQIWRHDNTDNIVSAVRNFFGLYDGAVQGVVFEDANGSTLIASHENFASGMTVYVRVVPELSQILQTQPSDLPVPCSPHRDFNKGSVLDQGIRISRPVSRSAMVGSRQSVSPSHHFNSNKIRPRVPVLQRSREASFQARLDEINSDSANHHSSSDDGDASVSSSFRARTENLASAEISVENIVAGGRRQRAKFESSELPLFVPPQVPAANSISSVSPQRRSNGNDFASPFALPVKGSVSRTQPWPSPIQSSHGVSECSKGAPTPIASSITHGHRLRDRINAPSTILQRQSQQYPAVTRKTVPQNGRGLGILPTPDPTVASTISDEDVALQLMRLADPSTTSHGRASASTLDDALSGRADHASSASSEADGVNGVEHEERGDAGYNGFKTRDRRSLQVKREWSSCSTTKSGAASSAAVQGLHTVKRQKVESSDSKSNKAGESPGHKKPTAQKFPKQRQQSSAKKARLSIHGNGDPASHHQRPVSPSTVSSAIDGSVEGRTMDFGPAKDGEDLSSKPRCQRCRKSKKGCDRQRPCQRCKDAGIGIEGCISEDENNGRKGRFGRHMGVTLSKQQHTTPCEINMSHTSISTMPMDNEVFSSPEKIKKSRKR